MYNIRFDYRRLREDLGLPMATLPALFKKHFNLRLSRATTYAWFQRGAMPVERLTQLLSIVRVETGQCLDIWRYIKPSEKNSRAA